MFCTYFHALSVSTEVGEPFYFDVLTFRTSLLLFFSLFSTSNSFSSSSSSLIFNHTTIPIKRWLFVVVDVGLGLKQVFAKPLTLACPEVDEVGLGCKLGQQRIPIHTSGQL